MNIKQRLERLEAEQPSVTPRLIIGADRAECEAQARGDDRPTMFCILTGVPRSMVAK